MKKDEYLPGLPRGVKPYDWALKQLRIAKAHETTRGYRKVVVALIDIGYRHHPDLDGHLWENPHPKKGDLHGWDFVDNDTSLEYTNSFVPNHDYYYGHHVFVAGEIAAVAPDCPIMIVRDGYANPDSWWQGIRYAVDNGAKVLVIPHGYLTGEKAQGMSSFYQGTDFTYPYDNPEIRKALDYAYDNNCLIVKGTADNRGRCVACATPGFETVFAVGSTNRRDEPADICCSADYVEAGTPGGERHSKDERDRIWGCGGDRNYIPFTGGCMASGFGGGVAALVWSRFPELSNEQIRQILRNTCRSAKRVTPNEEGWEHKLGYGIFDASKAVSIKQKQLCRDVRLIPSSVRIMQRKGKYFVEASIKNYGVFDTEKAIVVAYNGDSARPVDPKGTWEKPAQILQTKQIGHTIGRVRGLHETQISIELIQKPTPSIWFETFCLDRHDFGKVQRAKS